MHKSKERVGTRNAVGFDARRVRPSGLAAVFEHEPERAFSLCSLSFKLAYFLVETCDAKGQRSCANTCAQEGLALQRQRAAQISELRSGIKLLGSNDETSCIYLDLIWIPRCMQDILMPIHKGFNLWFTVLLILCWWIFMVSSIKTSLLRVYSYFNHFVHKPLMSLPCAAISNFLNSGRGQPWLAKPSQSVWPRIRTGFSELQTFGGRIMAHTHKHVHRERLRKSKMEPRAKIQKTWHAAVSAVQCSSTHPGAGAVATEFAKFRDRGAKSARSPWSSGGCSWGGTAPGLDQWNRRKQECRWSRYAWASPRANFKIWLCKCRCRHRR